MKSFNELTKEQKQWVVMAVLGVAALIYGGLTYGFSPLFEQKAEVEKQFGPNSLEIQKYTKLKADRPKIEAKALASAKALEVYREFMVPRGNEMVWLTDLISPVCDSVGIWPQDRTVELFGVRDKIEADAMVEYYTFQTTLNCGFHQFGRFLAELERKVAVLVVKDIFVSATPESETNVKVTLTCSLPRLTTDARKRLDSGDLL